MYLASTITSSWTKNLPIQRNNIQTLLLASSLSLLFHCQASNAYCHTFGINARPTVSIFIKRSILTYSTKEIRAKAQYSSTRSQQQHSALLKMSLSSNSNDDLLFVDIGANLVDPMYQGSYREKQRHEADLDAVLQRAWDNHLDKIIITAGTVPESDKAMDLIEKFEIQTTNDQSTQRLFSTVGVHPTRCKSEFGETDASWEKYLQSMKETITRGIENGHVVAMGELGLDYARLQFCDVETQKRGFIAQLQIAKEFNLPLFLHNRETGTDLLDILKEHYYNDDTNTDQRAGGVVHSFDDTLELAEAFMELGLFIGINGCSLKTEDNLNVAKEIPLDRLLLETDCPWCDIRQSHAGFGHVQTKFPTKPEKKYEPGSCVKGRYEPCHIRQVAEVIAGVKGVSVEEVAKTSRENAYRLFHGLEK